MKNDELSLIYLLTGTDKTKELLDNVRHLCKNALERYNDYIVVVSNQVNVAEILKPYLEQYKDRFFFIWTNRDSGHDKGAQSEVAMGGVFCTTDSQLKKSDFIVHLHWDVILHNVDGIREVCKKMKNENKKLAWHYRKINVDKNEIVSPHSFFFIVDNQWNNQIDFLRRLKPIRGQSNKPGVIDEKTGFEITLRLFAEKEFNIKPIYPEYNKIFNMGLVDYFFDDMYVFHTHNEEDYEKLIKKYKIK